VSASGQGCGDEAGSQRCSSPRSEASDVDASRQQIEVARAAIAQAQESLRINQNRYDSGLTTITDVLGAEDVTRRSQTDYWEAIYRFRTSYANLELASGSLNPQSPVLMP
jgi:outer membrane protein